MTKNDLSIPFQVFFMIEISYKRCWLAGMSALLLICAASSPVEAAENQKQECFCLRHKATGSIAYLDALYFAPADIVI